jgi:hypothetical protein
LCAGCQDELLLGLIRVFLWDHCIFNMLDLSRKDPSRWLVR